MLNKLIFSPLRGVIALLLLCINAILLPTVVILFAALIFLLPLKRWRIAARSLLGYIPSPWTSINSAIINISNRKKWNIELDPAIQNNKPYLIICNHLDWIDILVLYKVFNWGIQPLKFFMKKELLWSLPIVGLACKAIGFPFLERHSSQAIRKNPSLRGKDIATTRKCCQRFSEISSSLMIFAEGTRYSPKKARKQKSPYKHLLKPKAGGLSIVLEEMHNHLAGIIDVTLAYKTQKLGLWRLLKGDIDKIFVRARVIPISDELIGNYNENREFRIKLQQQLNNIWQRKDELIDQLESS